MKSPLNGNFVHNNKIEDNAARDEGLTSSDYMFKQAMGTMMMSSKSAATL